MPRDDLATANRRLAGAESFTIAPSKYLGHHVAGNLAARHGIRVHLESGANGGITALVALPPSLLNPATSVNIPPAPGRRTSPAAMRRPDRGPAAPPAGPRSRRPTPYTGS
ncbi:MAG TPA: hypothetical protein VFI47_12340 [Acidimicrobiales bacterium]|nr:hypothetical protein [Acidimicrobiales bacterium]